MIGPRATFILWLCGAFSSFAATSAADLAHQLSQISIDPDACYRVTDLNFSKDDIRIYLTSGYVAFAKPINGERVAAVFVNNVDAGDAELLMIPPVRSERLSLANFTQSPNLDEHFQAAAMLFTDRTATELQAAIESAGSRKNPETGAALSESYTSLLRNLTESFRVRLIHDMLDLDRRSGLFYMGVAGKKLGNFDVVYDPMALDQITVGQLSFRDNRSYFDTWTSFQDKKVRQDSSAIMPLPFTLDHYHIDATIHPDLTVSAVTQATLSAKRPVGRALPFWISRQMRVTEAKVDGVPVEVFQRESLRATAIKGNDNEEFLLVMPEPLDTSKAHEIEIHHEGKVIGKAGEHVFYVTARGTWYPRLGGGFAQYDLTFKYPKELVLVSTGDPAGDRTDGDWHISEFHSPAPLRFAGFNLGTYSCVSTRSREGYLINVCANREVEAGLKRSALSTSSAQEIPHPEGIRRGRTQIPDIIAPQPPPNPGARLELLAVDVSAALQYMATQYGPPPLHRLSVAPIPASFGQGFPGLIYLSTLSYLDPTQRPPGIRNPYTQMFFSDVLDAHEVAHQWWGNLVTSEGYSDEWLMEALADYSALMFLEKKNGTRALDTVLERYRTHLTNKTENGHTLESTGPITWGSRLISSHSPESWRAIVYEKGAWIFHMIRRRLGDERFSSMLREICEKYRYRAFTTEQLRETIAHYAPPKSADADFKIFFDTWVYGVGIPTVKMTRSIRGSKITGTLTATDAGDDFTGLVPVEVQQARQRTVHWLHVSSEGSPFSITLAQPANGAKISILSADCLIAK